MISVTRLDGSKVVINDDLVVFIERTPDTVITLTTGERVMVKEGVEEVVRKVLDYRQRMHLAPPTQDTVLGEPSEPTQGDN